MALNRSVKQLVAPLAAVPPPTVVMVAPFRKAVLVTVEVEGPVIEKVSKSSLIWQMLLLIGHTLETQFPLSSPPLSK